MPSSYTNLLYHIVFATKHRKPTLAVDVQEEVLRYIAGIIANKQGKLLEAGGMDDHVHLLAACSPRLALSDFIRDVKANSSKWLHEDKKLTLFQWQSGYGAFTVSCSQVEVIRRYIQNQAEHHRKQTFEEEFRAILTKHGITYDEGRLFDEEHHG